MQVNESNRSARGLDRDRILSVATRHFARFGYRKTSLSDVAGELGVVKGALYYYFPGGKFEIFDTASSRVEAEMLERMRSAVRAESDPRRALRDLFATKYACLTELLDAHGVSAEVGQELVAVPREAASFQEGERKLIEELLASGERHGAFHRIRPRAAAAAAIQSMLRQPLIEAALAAPAGKRGTLPLHPTYFEILLDGVSAGRPGTEDKK